MKKLSRLIVSLFAGALTVAGFSALIINRNDTNEVHAIDKPSSMNDYSICETYHNANNPTNLLTALRDVTDFGDTMGYDGLWNIYSTCYVRDSQGHIFDYYSNITNYTSSSSHSGNSYEGAGYNREHSIPKSWWGGSTSNQGADPYIVVPTDCRINGFRSSYPFGMVGTVDSSKCSSGNYSKLGSGLSSWGYAGKVFEPNDSVKGDFARIYFYAIAKYSNSYSWTQSDNADVCFSGNASTNHGLTDYSVKLFSYWSEFDPVSDWERSVNDKVSQAFGNRNPFIDHPEYANTLWGTNSNYTTYTHAVPSVGITSISKTSANLIAGNSTTISATSSNSGAITWTSSNTNVATLNSGSAASGANVTINAISAGTSTITASITISGETYSLSCEVNVAAAKQVTSISVSSPKTSYAVDDTFVKPTVTANYNDGTQAIVTDDASFTGYDMSVADSYTVTVSYSYGGATKTTTFEIVVSSSGGGGSIDDYTVSTTPLTSSGITNGMKVVFGTSSTNLAVSCDSNWIYLSSTRANWKIFTIEGTSSGFKLHCDDGYIYCSAAKKVAFSTTNSTTFTLRSDNLVTSSSSGTFYFNTSGLRPYTSSSSSYTDAFLYALISNKTLSEMDIDTYPTKMSYHVGEYFDPTGLVISRTYSDGSEDTYTYVGHTSEFSFDPSLVTPLSASDETVEITYGGQSCFLTIEVSLPKELSSISISGYTTSFVEGDTFSFGGTVTANYADSTSDNVTSSTTFSGYDMTTVGNQTVTVSYGGKSQTYNITVSPGTLSSIAVSGMTTTYTRNASFSFDGTCTATFENSYQKTVTPTSVTSPDMSTAGNKTITVSYTYNGRTRSTTYNIAVNSYRTVMEASTVEGTITWSSSTATISGSVTGLAAKTSGKTCYESQSMRLGTGSGGGTLAISASVAITSLKISAKYYTTYSSSVLKADGSSVGSLTSSYKDYMVTLSSAKTSVTVLTENSSSRVNIQSITVYANGPETDIGQSKDCVGLESFINTYMHMDYTENLGYCKDSEHHYYSTAKTAFNLLNTHQRSLFTGNSAYSAEWARLSAWASFNGDALNSSNQLESAPKVDVLSINGVSNDNLLFLVILSSVSILTLGVFIYIKKRKAN